MGYRIQNRRDTAARWAEINPILLEGEIGYVSDNPNQYKIGDGVSAWNSLPLRGFNGTIAPTLGYNDDAVPSQRVITESFDSQSEKLSELGSEVKQLNQDNIVIESIGENINLRESLILANAFIGDDGTIKEFPTSSYNIYGKSFLNQTAIKVSRSKLPASGAGVIAVVDSLNDVVIGKKLTNIIDNGLSDYINEIVFIQPNQYIIISEQSVPSTSFTEVTAYKVNEYANRLKRDTESIETKVDLIEDSVNEGFVYGYEDGAFFEITEKVLDSAFINSDGVVSSFSNAIYNLWAYKITEAATIRVRRELPSSGGSGNIYVVNDLSEVYVGAILKNKIDDGTSTSIDIIFKVEQGQYIIWGGQTVEKGNTKFNYTFKISVKEAVQQLSKIWEGKKWAAIGDSITEINARASKNYVGYIEDNTGITAENLGISGTGYCRDEKFYTRLDKVSNDCNVITFFGGGNDKGELPIGEVSDTGENTLCGWINKTFDKCVELYPLIPFGVIIPFPWRGCMPYDTNGNGVAFRNVCEALIDICRRRSIPYLDLYHLSGLSPNNTEFLKVAYSKDTVAKKTLSPSGSSVLITSDNIDYYQSISDDTLSVGDYVDLGGGVHPDENGHKLIAPKIKSFLETLIM